MLITGISGAEFGIRGFIDGWDPETGKQLWRRYTIPAPGEKGTETWPRTPTPEDRRRLGLAHRLLRSRARSRLLGHRQCRRRGIRTSGKGDNLYTASVLAMRPKTGEIVWHYQFTPNDPYDYDANWEIDLADINVERPTRKVLMQLNRNGFLYVLDRTNGKLICGQAIREGQLGDGHRHEDRPADRDRDRRQELRAGEEIEMWPSTRGGKNWPHASFNPETGLLYAQHHASRRHRTSIVTTEDA